MIESSLYPSSHDYGQAMSLSRSHVRSSPIAIIQPKSSKDDEFDHSDSDESIIDVELDALKIRQKQEQQYGSAKPAESSISLKQEKELKAPYLGSLSKSESNLLSLPPMALSESYMDDPPSEIMSYGSLRDSQQKGRFIDGPMSYREPASGRIMQYDRRQKYQSVPPTQSIGERLQQSRKLKEIRHENNNQEEQILNKVENSSNNKNATSSLSAMMNDASQQIPKVNAQKTAGFLDPSQVNMESFMPTFGFYDTEPDDHMLSTSLTAFEILQTKMEPPARLDSGNLTNNAVYQAGFTPLERSNSDPLPQPHHPPKSVFSPLLPSQVTQAPPTMSHFSLGPSPMTVHGRADQGGADVSMSFNNAHDDSPDMDVAFDMDM